MYDSQLATQSMTHYEIPQSLRISYSSYIGSALVQAAYFVPRKYI